MACFLVPAAEAVVATVVTKAVKSKEIERIKLEGAPPVASEETEKIPFFRKLKWLTNLLWGGAVLLAFEHVWHGEVTPWFPFLTAAGNPSDTSEMLHEMATAGVSMAALVTAVWGGMILVVGVMEKKVLKAQSEIN